MNQLPPLAWLGIALLLLGQSTWLFLNARKHGHNYWLWGTLGLIHFPAILLIYLIFVRKIFRKKR
jgi:hypothetical protein